MDTIQDFHFSELPDGSIQLALKFANSAPQVAIIAPELVAQMLATLMHLVPRSNDPDVKKWAQLLAIREVSGRVEHGLATLTYQLEGADGVELTSTIEADCATALSLALATATIDPSKH
jgi:hypothetical protein